MLMKVGMGDAYVPYVWVLRVKTMWGNFPMNDGVISKMTRLTHTIQYIFIQYKQYNVDRTVLN